VIEEEPTKIELNDMRTLLLSPRATLEAFPPQLNFGNVLTDGEGSTQSLTLKNSGNISLTIQTISISGINPGDFSLLDTVQSQVLAPSDSVAVAVTFAPGDVTSRSATLTVTYNGVPLPVHLSGIGK
jgi:hypothetical protein